MTWKEEIVEYFVALWQQLSGGTEENDEKPQSPGRELNVGAPKCEGVLTLDGGFWFRVYTNG
jgi:hypothetical protein